jgi:hypothetical protein
MALLEYLGKLLKKIIMRCLTYDITALQLIPTTQAYASCMMSKQPMPLEESADHCYSIWKVFLIMLTTTD